MAIVVWSLVKWRHCSQHRVRGKGVKCWSRRYVFHEDSVCAFKFPQETRVTLKLYTTHIGYIYGKQQQQLIRRTTPFQDSPYATSSIFHYIPRMKHARKNVYSGCLLTLCVCVFREKRTAHFHKCKYFVDAYVCCHCLWSGWLKEGEWEMR